MAASENDKKTRMARVPDEDSGMAFYVELTDEQGMEMSRLMKAIDKVGVEEG